MVAPVAILKRLVEHPVISLNTFYGAVCVYMLIAMFFATLYGLIALVSGGPVLRAAAGRGPQRHAGGGLPLLQLRDHHDHRLRRLHGRDDIGRMTAVIEAIFGQLYLITVVALVVQNLGQKTRLGRDGGAAGDEAGRARASA